MFQRTSRDTLETKIHPCTITDQWIGIILELQVGCISCRDVNKDRGVKAKATDPRPRLRPRM